MLNILVFVKQVPDIDLVRMDPETGNLVRTGVPSLMNPLDTNALEAAIRTKEQYGGTVTAVTMGPPAAEAVLREALSVGADNAILCSGREFGGADTLSTSYVLVQAAKQLGEFDLIFCGKESTDGATGQMGSQLAERFNASQVSSLYIIDSIDESAKKVIVRRELPDGIETVEAALPCLFTVAKTNYPARIPNLKGYLASKRAEISVLGPNDIKDIDLSKVGVPGSGTIVPKIYPPELPEAGQIIDEGDVRLSAHKLVGILADNGSL